MKENDFGWIISIRRLYPTARLPMGSYPRNSSPISATQFRPFIEVMQPLLFNQVEGTFQGALELGGIDESRTMTQRKVHNLR
jgi:hypothetical protein